MTTDDTRLELIDAIADIAPDASAAEKVRVVNAIEDLIERRITAALKTYSLRVEDATGIRP